MNRKKRISQILQKDLKDFDIRVEDRSYLHKGHNNFDGSGETHILIELKPKNETIYNRLKVHRKINNALKEEFSQGLHSLEIKVIN